MSNDPIKSISGIGPVKEKEFHKLKIFTVGDLAKIQPGHLPVPIDNLGALIARAKSHIKILEEPVAPTSIVKLGPAGAQLQSLVPKAEEQKKEMRVLIESHSWKDEMVIVPDPIEPNIMRKAVIYELTVEPCDRVAMLCEWICEEDDSECVMSYSPQLILHFNPHLKVLTCDVDPDDWEKMPNKHVVTNVIWETNAMKR